MHLLFVIDTLALGGAQRQMVNLAVGLHKRGHQAAFFRYVPGDTLLPSIQAAQMPIHTCFKRSRYDPSVFLKLHQIVQHGKYDLVVSYLPQANFITLVAVLPLRSKPRTVISERSSSLSQGIMWRTSIFRHSYRLADHITTNSHHQRVFLSQKYRWMKGKISTIYNGLDLDVFSPSIEEPVTPPFKLLAIGSVHRSKNAECLIQALVILRDCYGLCPQVNWAGRHLDGYSEELDREIQRQDLTTQWHWLGERTDIVDLLHQHHALVHPSYAEGLPNVVCEALACGRPVLVSDTLDHPNLVRHGKTGFLFDWKSPKALADCIKGFLNLPSPERHQMGQNGRRYAEQHLSTDQMVDDYEKLFESLLGPCGQV